MAVVAALRDTSSEELWAQLLPAVQDGLIVAASERSAECSFFHDRIQQAAYESLEPQQRSRTHLAIGRLLREAEDTDPFEVVFQLNQGRALIEDPAERLQLSERNLEAGRKATASAANVAAMGYFDIGLELLPEEPWSACYDLTLGLHRSAGETAWVLADLDRSDALVAAAVANAETALEKR
ncbi:MAG: hypothetical protein GY898_17580 [Proteobacteria bacterium]|nr:hypothetical protein [Pseudomonadota bacterium]